MLRSLWVEKCSAILHLYACLTVFVFLLSYRSSIAFKFGFLPKKSNEKYAYKNLTQRCLLFQHCPFTMSFQWTPSCPETESLIHRDSTLVRPEVLRLLEECGATLSSSTVVRITSGYPDQRIATSASATSTSVPTVSVSSANWSAYWSL